MWRRWYLLLFTALLSVCCKAQSYDNSRTSRPKAAVYVMGNAAENEKSIFASRIIDVLTESNKYSVMERSAEIIRMLKQEMNYQLSGEVDKGEISQIGRKLGVDNVFVIDFSTLRSGEYFASIRNVNITTGQILASEYALKSISSMSELTGIARSLGQQLVSATPPPRNAEKSAVYVTTGRGLDSRYKSIIESVFISGLTKTSQSTNNVVIERSQDFLRELNKENVFQQSGEVSDEEIRALGRKFGVKTVYAVVVTPAFGDYSFDARRINVEQQNLDKSWSKEGACNSFRQAIELTSALVKANPVSGGASGFSNGKRTFTVNGVSFNMVSVQGGIFNMGATYEQGSEFGGDERPVHQVTLSNYMIGETEVTQELWQAVMGVNPSYFKGPRRPVENVSWNDCQEFISRLNQLTGQHFRLPTEAEWEYAARGGNKSRSYKYSGSLNIFDVAWHGENSNSQTHDVATKSPNELGIYDMSGNVWEWCSDWYGRYSNGSQTNPTGASSGSLRVGRGGSWGDNAGGCRVSNRSYSAPSYRSCGIGLRLAL